MFAIIRAAIAATFIAEVAGTFALGLVALILFGFHVTGVAFWSAEAVVAIGVGILTVLFFLKALAYERSVIMQKI